MRRYTSIVDERTFSPHTTRIQHQLTADSRDGVAKRDDAMSALEDVGSSIVDSREECLSAAREERKHI